MITVMENILVSGYKLTIITVVSSYSFILIFLKNQYFNFFYFNNGITSNALGYISER